MQPHIRAALEWIDTNPTRHAHERGDFLQYGTRSQQGLTNQGWKDSGNSIIHTDGALCAPPIALVEVQGYTYRAEREMADLYRLHGDEHAARALDEQAARMRARFNDAFWMPDTNFYALCLARDNHPSKVIASNPGQALFTGIVDDEKARLVRDRLMRPDMFAGWGIRTLSAEERAYNPLDYQVGAFWPHDNALIMLGLWEYGFDEAAERLFTGMFQAAQAYDHYRLPECFAGFGQDEYDFPVKYPVACSPQAWASGALPLMLRVALGLKARALEKRLLIHHPHLPPWLERVSLAGLKVGQATVDLDYRLLNGHTAVFVTGRSGQLDVHVEY
jgi:glycogen debranching enzyme